MNDFDGLARSLLGLAVLGLATPAAATIVVDTYSGTIIAPQEYTNTVNDIDGEGLFGPAGASLLGDTFQAVVTTDTLLAAATYSGSTGPGSTYYNGGAVYGTGPYNMVTLTINEPGRPAESVTWFGSYLGRTGYFSSAQAGYGQSSESSFVGLQPSTPNSTTYVFNDGVSPTPASLPSFPASFTADGSFSAMSTSGYFYVTTDNSLYTVVGDTSASFSTTCFVSGSAPTCSVSPPPGVPEPATWTMMLVGVAFMGGALRLSRRSPLSA